MFNVTTYGAIGDGITDDTTAIQDTIDACALLGGGIVYFPKGDYLIGSNLGITTDNIYLQGEGRGVTKIKLANNADSHMIVLDGISGGGLKGIELDGNSANQTLGVHGIRGGGDMENWTCEDFYIHDTFGYGIGLQYGTIKGCIIKDGIISDTGSDGFDCKNRNDDNSDNTMYNVHTYRTGLNTNLTSQTGFDFRGQWNISSITAREYSGACTTGIRFRAGETIDDSGFGGMYSCLNNFFVRPSTTSGTIGVEISSYQVQVGIGQVQNAGTGYSFNQSEVTLGQLIAKSCVDGFRFNSATGLATDADRCIGSGLIARSCTGVGFRIYSDYVNLSVVARSCGTGVNIYSTANHTTVSGVSQTNTTDLVNSGTNSHLGGLL
jgi:hypothetical protein